MSSSSQNNGKDGVRVRFAPSPTGYLHIGGARTALYNWLWARKNGGTLILRIEDTDVERSTEQSIQEILDGLTWLGLDWDEGPNLQSANLPLHIEAANKLLESGHAYRCFCSKEELDEQRKTAEANKVAFMYNRRCRDLTPEQIDAKLSDKTPFVIRFAVPTDPAETVVFEDRVYGRNVKRASDIEDFVIVRSDGRPLYLLSNAVDDAVDRVTHVIRGADGMANTPKQSLIYRALGYDIPIFAHMPLTLDNKKAKLSKRKHGEVVTISFYRENGFLPWALCNFMALLGWSGSGEKEFYSRQELLEAFELTGINRANSRFNYTPGDPKNWTDPKAIHFNATYIRTMDLEELIPYVRQELESAGLWDQEYESAQKDWFYRTIDLIRARFHTLKDFSSLGRCYFSDEFHFDPKAVKKNLGKDPRLKEWLPELGQKLEKLDSFDKTSIEKVFRDFAQEKDISAGILINASRTAVSGVAVGPGLFELLEVVGGQRVAKRLMAAGSIAAGN
jgi:glutamyl-tRNA synthetase